MFVMDYYGHKLSNGVLFAHHLILDVPGGSSHLGYRRRVAICNNPRTRVNVLVCVAAKSNLALSAASESASWRSVTKQKSSSSSERAPIGQLVWLQTFSRNASGSCSIASIVSLVA